MLGPLCNQTVYMGTDAKILYYSLLKLKQSYIFKAQKRLCIFKKQKQKFHKQVLFYQKWDAFHEQLCCIFGDFYASGMQDTKGPKSLHVVKISGQLHAFIMHTCHDSIHLKLCVKKCDTAACKIKQRTGMGRNLT